MAELAIRMVASLAIVVGLLLLIARVTGRRFQGKQGSLVTVLHRQSLGRSSSVAVVSVGTRVLVLGSTEQQVAILAELQPGEVDALGGTHREAAAGRSADFAAELSRTLSEPDAGDRPPGRHAAPLALPARAPTTTAAAPPVRSADPLPAPVLLHPVGRHAAPRSHRAVRDTGAPTPAPLSPAPAPSAPSTTAAPVTPEPHGSDLSGSGLSGSGLSGSGLSGSGLSGSVLSPQTWRQALHAVTGRAS